MGMRNLQREYQVKSWYYFNVNGENWRAFYA
jgi:hypothetical protein